MELSQPATAKVNVAAMIRKLARIVMLRSVTSANGTDRQLFHLD